MEQHKDNKTLAEITTMCDSLEATGKSHFDEFKSLVVEKSNVPEEFFDALVNISSHVQVPKSGDGAAVLQESVRRLLGINCKTSEDAIFVASLGNAISLVKRLQNPNLDESKKTEIRRDAERMVGESLLLQDSILSRHSGRMNRHVFNKPSTAAINRIEDLQKQLEQRVSDPTVKARILLFAQPKRT